MRPPGGVIKIGAASSRLARAFVFVVGATVPAACIPTATNLSPDAGELPCVSGGNACIPNGTPAPVTTAPTVDCTAAEAGLEFLTDFSVLDNETGNAAQYFYQYVDGTAGIWPNGYTPPAIQQNICNSDTNNHVLHESGGPFTGWGGGIGIGLSHISGQDKNLCGNFSPSNTCPVGGGWQPGSNPCYCPAYMPDPKVNGVQPKWTNDQNASTAINYAALDVSQWEGVSFWARRGPNGQPLMRVLVGDKFTDDDISYLMYRGSYPNVTPSDRFCERKGECTCSFQDVTCDWYSVDDPSFPPGTVWADTNPALPMALRPGGLSPDGGGFYCGTPGSHPGSASSTPTMSNGSLFSNFCGRSLCDRPYSAYPNDTVDLEWTGRACTPYTYRNGSEADVCYNPPNTVDGQGNKVDPDPLPAEADKQCGDHFTFPVHLSTDWQFFAIPFAQMSQQGWAQQAPYFDATSVSVIRFTWDAGYVDYYLDNIRFYRTKGFVPPTPPYVPPGLPTPTP
jgi:hypothetical protein